MKIAVKSTNGIQTDIDNKLRYYYSVDDNYDFNLNEAIDVTDISNLNLWSKTFKIYYSDFRDSIIQFTSVYGFQNLSDEEKEIVAYNFAVSKVDRDSVYTNDEQIENAIDLQFLLANSEKYTTAVLNSDNYVNSISAITFSDIALKYTTITASTISTENLYTTVLSATTLNSSNIVFNNLSASTDITITNSSYGFILKSPDSSSWRITIDNLGILTTTKI